MGSLAILAFLLMTIFALLGKQLFGGMYDGSTGYSSVPCIGGVCADPDLEDLPHYHFDYFGPALTTVLILVTGEWSDAMGPAAGVHGPVVAWYFVPVSLIGLFLLINLFIGVLLNEFQEEDEEVGADAEEQQAAVEESIALLPPPAAPPPAPAAKEAGRGASSRASREGRGGKQGGGGRVANGREGEGRGVPISWPRDYSLGLCSIQTPGYRLCRAIVSSPSFEPMVLVLIAGSTLCLGLDSPRLEKDSDLYATLRLFDKVSAYLY